MATAEELKDIDTFFARLEEAGALASVWRAMPEVLRGIDHSLTKAALRILGIYFSYIDAGNTCIPLDEDILYERWQDSWQKLQISQAASEPSPVTKADLAAGIRDIKTAGTLLENTFTISNDTKGTPWLFARRYYDAKIRIEKRLSQSHSPALFTAPEMSAPVPEADIQACIERFSKITSDSKGRPFTLNCQQATAIVRGQKESLIITGGPGTGKTTVVCFLLWELLADSAFADCTLFLAAPSGKAADRMKESVGSGLAALTEEERSRHAARFKKLEAVTPRTIHRLLSFNPIQGGFSYNRDHPFPDNSVFVIDEASMIDIELFSSLLDAIPDKARLFLLGDRNQLPSVEAGAVLADLIAQKRGCLVELTESKRFSAASEAGAIAAALQKEEPLPKLPFKNAGEFTCRPSAKDGAYPVSYYTASSEKDIHAMLEAWTETFYSSLQQHATKLPNSPDQATLNTLWNLANSARILCAERSGMRGAETINSTIQSLLQKKNAAPGKLLGLHYSGQLLMVTKNQKMYNLSNGDCGIVVSFAGGAEAKADDALLYLMLQKSNDESGVPSVQSGEIFHIGNYMFYPLHYISEDSLDIAYAITIHKSQGSGYDNILIFLPEQERHPLLNRQLVYTAITRTQGNTSIVASQKTMEAAHQTVIRRDSQLILG
ncbi:MAG: AAA family ATPase [Treponema sp.]|nr:AAA family ATPase [Treponema sp.]